MCHYVASTLGKRLVSNNARPLHRYAQPGRSHQPFNTTSDPSSTHPLRSPSGLISNPHPRQPASAATRDLFRQTSNQRSPQPSTYASVVRDSPSLPSTGTSRRHQASQSRFSSRSPSLHSSSTGTSSRRQASQSHSSSHTPTTVPRTADPRRATGSTRSPGIAYRSRLFRNPSSATLDANRQYATDFISRMSTEQALDTNEPSTSPNVSLLQETSSSNSHATSSDSSFTFVSPRRTRSGKVLHDRLSQMEYCSSVLEMGVASLHRVSTLSPNSQSSVSHVADARPLNSIMPPPRRNTDTESLGIASNTTVSQSFSSPNPFSALSSDFASEADPNIDELCVSQEEPVLVTLRTFKTFILESATDQIREQWLPETSNLIAYLKQKEQRASKTNSRLLELNCSKCGQLFSSPTGLRTHLNA